MKSERITGLISSDVDFSNLFFLNRKERLQYLSNLKKLPKDLRRKTMVDLLTEVKAFDADGSEIKNKSGNIPSLKEVILFALRVPLDSDSKQGFSEKSERYSLIKRIEPSGQIEITEDEKKKILDRVGRVYLQVGIVGRTEELLNGK